MTERTWMKKTCALCPFSRTKTLGLHPERAEELANMASNPFNDFPCHKTADYQEEDSIHQQSGYVHGDHSFTCHGFKTMQVAENGGAPGFVPDGDGFEDYFEMIQAHENIYQGKAND